MGMDKSAIAKSVYLQVGVIGNEEVKQGVKAFNEETKNATKAAGELGQKGGGIADELKGKFEGLKATVAGFVAVAGAKQLFDWSAEGAALLDLQGNVNRLKVSMAELQEAAGGEMSEGALGKAAVQAERLGKSLGLTEDQTKQLTIAATQLASAYNLDVADASRKLFTAVSGETGSLKEAFGLFVNAQDAIGAYAVKLGTTADKLTEFQQRSAILEAIQSKLNGVLQNAPVEVYGDRLDRLKAKTEDFTDSLKTALAQLLLIPAMEAITGDFASPQRGDRLAQARNRAQDLRQQLATDSFETSGALDVSKVDDRIRAEKELKEIEAAIPGLIAAQAVEAKKLAAEREQARIDAEGDAANERALMEIGQARIDAEKKRAEAAKAASAALAAERKAQEELNRKRREEAVLGRSLPAGTLDLLLNPYKEIQKKKAEDAKNSRAALEAEFKAQLDNDTRRLEREKTFIELEKSKRQSFLDVAKGAGQAQASRFGSGPGGTIAAGIQGSQDFGQIDSFNKAQAQGIILPGEAERAQLEAFRESINANITTPLDIAALASNNLTQGFADAAAASIVTGASFKKGLQGVFKSLAQLAISRSIFETAEALAAFAWGNAPGGFAHLKAAATFAAVAAGAYAATKASGGSFGAPSSSSGSGENSRAAGSGASRGVANPNNNTTGGSNGTTVFNINVAYNGFTADAKGHEKLMQLINGQGWRPGSPKIDPRVIAA